MGTIKLKSEGGQGGRRGHSNMVHWSGTEEIKESARIRRRREGKAIIVKELSEALGLPQRLTKAPLTRDMR